jgi:hypothetical protein
MPFAKHISFREWLLFWMTLSQLSTIPVCSDPSVMPPDGASKANIDAVVVIRPSSFQAVRESHSHQPCCTCLA